MLSQSSFSVRVFRSRVDGLLAVILGVKSRGIGLFVQMDFLLSTLMHLFEGIVHVKYRVQLMFCSRD